MKAFDVCLKLGQLEFDSPEAAAANAFEGSFAEALYQPSEFEVTDLETGELYNIDLTHLHTDNALYGPKRISAGLRGSFHFAVSESFNIPGRGSVLTGKILSGVVKVGDMVVLNSNGNNLNLRVSFIELNRELIQEAYFTESVGLLFEAVDLSFSRSGDSVTGLAGN